MSINEASALRDETATNTQAVNSPASSDDGNAAPQQAEREHDFAAEERTRSLELERQATKSETVEVLNPSDPEGADISAARQRRLVSLGMASSYLNDTIEHGDATVPLAWQAFLTGIIDMLLYSRSQVWLGFQTGNMVQFSGNIAQFMIPSAETQPLLTLLRILSVVAFFLGSLVGFQFGRKLGHQKRSWMIASSVIQSAFLFGASGILLSRPESEVPTFQYYPGVIVLTAFSMGMQSIAAQKLVSPAFATTVAFTATLSQIASDPYLFTLVPSANTRGRDRRLLAIVMLCVGAGVGESFLHTSAGLRGGVTICAGFKLVLALLWLVPKGKKTEAKASKA